MGILGSALWNLADPPFRQGLRWLGSRGSACSGDPFSSWCGAPPVKAKVASTKALTRPQRIPAGIENGDHGQIVSFHDVVGAERESLRQRTMKTVDKSMNPSSRSLRASEEIWMVIHRVAQAGPWPQPKGFA
jgi:hypothetical protein